MLIRAFFRDHPGARINPITLEGFEKISQRNVGLMAYLDGGKDKTEYQKTVSSDLEKRNSKALFTAILLRFNTRTELVSMEIKEKGFLLLGIKSLIECMEESLLTSAGGNDHVIA